MLELFIETPITTDNNHTMLFKCSWPLYQGKGHFGVPTGNYHTGAVLKGYFH